MSSFVPTKFEWYSHLYEAPRLSPEKLQSMTDRTCKFLAQLGQGEAKTIHITEDAAIVPENYWSASVTVDGELTLTGYVLASRQTIDTIARLSMGAGSYNNEALADVLNELANIYGGQIIETLGKNTLDLDAPEINFNSANALADDDIRSRIYFLQIQWQAQNVILGLKVSNNLI